MGEVGAWWLHEILGGVFYAREPLISSGLCALAVTNGIGQGTAWGVGGTNTTYARFVCLCDMHWRGEPVDKSVDVK